MVKIKRALISVYDKANLADFIKGLKELGIEIISTGGTAEFIKSQGVEAKGISDLTNFPEILNGRVKTLHPKVHGALLSLRESHSHMAEIKSYGIETIDMVVVNLYPFNEVAAKPGIELKEALESIDIGGVSLLRSAAKNFSSVAVVSDPSQYGRVLNDMKMRRGLVIDELLSELAVQAFNITAEYDKAINSYLQSKFPPEDQKVEETPKPEPEPPKQEPEPPKQEPEPPKQEPEPTPEPQPQPKPSQEQAPLFPEVLNISLKKQKDLRYGENSHQKAAFYIDPKSKESSVSSAKQLHGKELSYNNIMDMDTALEIVKEFECPAASVIKHANPCGVATADNLAKAYTDAWECDKISAYGSIIGLNRVVDVATAEAILQSGFIECIIAPRYDDAALTKLKTKQNMRILEIPSFDLRRDNSLYSSKQVVGGMLIQTRDLENLDRAQLRIVTKKKPTAEDVDSLLFSWKVVKYVKSNAIVVTKDTRTIGIGAGQMSRVDSVFIATQKSGRASRGSTLASEAFFPKVDAVETAARAGIVAIIQPGGSKADDEIIRTADRRGLCMVFTGMRHFRH